MLEWFQSLDIAWQTAIFGATIPICGGLIKLLCVLSKFWAKVCPKVYENTITITNGCANNYNIAGRDIHTGVPEDVLIKAMEMVNTDQSNKLVSEFKKVIVEMPTSYTQSSDGKHNDHTLQLEKEIQLYADLWKVLVDVRSSIIITPTLDRVPKGKSPYDVYKGRCNVAIDTFNKAKNLFDNNRPFYHDDVSKITKEFLGQCRGYIFKVQRGLSSETFDDRLQDETDELLEIIPKAIDEIEKAIKVRIGLLPISEVDDSVPIGLGLGSIVEITNGSITYQSNTLNFQPLIGLKMSIIGGYVKRNGFGKLEAYIQTDMPFQSLQRLNEKLGLDSMRLLSESDAILDDIDNPVVFTSSTNRILPQGETVLNLATWQEGSFPMTMHVQATTTASGYLKGKVFQGKFEASLTYNEINLQLSLYGDFQAHLA
ncbi:MAG: hypothetical protein A2Y07_03335 [Planctomycetes bacterium GWF2_50_10]|nr:MAG: hypothetical protein A2Y07_03335 [Planctomycetes bacterium GWF2_50_10]